MVHSSFSLTLSVYRPREVIVLSEPFQYASILSLTGFVLAFFLLPRCVWAFLLFRNSETPTIFYQFSRCSPVPADLVFNLNFLLRPVSCFWAMITVLAFAVVIRCVCSVIHSENSPLDFSRQRVFAWSEKVLGCFRVCILRP